MEEGTTTSQPQLTIEPVTDRPPLPTHLKMLGYGNLVIGVLLTIVNYVVVSQSISRLKALNAPEGFPELLRINIVIYVVVGALLVVGGIGLILNRRWGRTWSLIAAVSCFLAVLGAMTVGKTMEALLQSGAYPLHPGQTYFVFKLPLGAPVLSPLYGILILVLLMLPDARAWARRTSSSATGGADSSTVGSAATVTRPMSGLAIGSFVCSLIPMMLLTQIAGLTLGIIALAKIRKSNGALGGKGFAIAGVIISSLILIFIGGVILLIFLSSGFK